MLCKCASILMQALQIQKKPYSEAPHTVLAGWLAAPIFTLATLLLLASHSLLSFLCLSILALLKERALLFIKLLLLLFPRFFSSAPPPVHEKQEEKS